MKDVQYIGFYIKRQDVVTNPVLEARERHVAVSRRMRARSLEFSLVSRRDDEGLPEDD